MNSLDQSVQSTTQALKHRLLLSRLGGADAASFNGLIVNPGSVSLSALGLADSLYSGATDPLLLGQVDSGAMALPRFGGVSTSSLSVATALGGQRIQPNAYDRLLQSLAGTGAGNLASLRGIPTGDLHSYSAAALSALAGTTLPGTSLPSLRPHLRLTPSLIQAQSLISQTGAGSLPTQVRNTLCGAFAGSAARNQLPALLARPEDEMKLSAHQVLLRLQIEVFEATEDDVSTHTRGRNKPIQPGQVGIRCRHCAHLPVVRRQKGSTYFPASTMGIYQAAQNMSTTHIQCGLCVEMPESIKQQFVLLMASKLNSSGAGRPYWADSAKKLGLVDTEENGIRTGCDLTTQS